MSVCVWGVQKANGMNIISLHLDHNICVSLFDKGARSMHTHTQSHTHIYTQSAVEEQAKDILLSVVFIAQDFAYSMRFKYLSLSLNYQQT